MILITEIEFLPHKLTSILDTFKN